MELKEIINQVRKTLSFIILVSLSLAILTGLAAQKYTPRYHAGLNLYIDKPHEVSNAGDYSYDGFYAQQVAEAYTDTVVGLLESPDILVQALSKLEIDDIAPYKGVVVVEKTAPQIISFKTVLADRDLAVNLVKSVAEATKERVVSLNNEQNQRIEVELIYNEPLVEFHEVAAWLGGLVGFLFGALMSITLIIFRQYLRSGSDVSA